jgi:hypothetical protein
MYRTIIRKETTSRGNVVLTFNGVDHAEGMLFKDEEEFQMFRDYLNTMNVLGATSLDRLE